MEQGSPPTKYSRESGETEGDELQVHDLKGGTLTGIRTENGEGQKQCKLDE